MIPVQFEREWELPLDPKNEAVKRFPKGLVVEVEDDVAAAAIASGVARPLVDLPEHVAAEVDRNKQFLADVDTLGLDAALDKLEGGAAEPATEAAPEGDPTVVPLAEKKKGRTKAESA
jgi:hypothetical protein